MSESIFSKSWYHLVASLIYVASGTALLFAGSRAEEPVKTKAIGIIIIVYGLYRLAMRFLFNRKKTSKSPDKI